VAVSYQPRLVDELLDQRMRHHSAILLVGPRATGKTTTGARLAKSILRLDERGQAVAAEADPDAALRGFLEPILIDEWQLVPDILGAVKRAVDTDPAPGRFLITGSVRGDIDFPTWPGTGRLLRIAMNGLTVAEIRGTIPTVPLLDRLDQTGCEALVHTKPEELDLRDYAELAAVGGFPQPALRLSRSERTPWLESYVDQLLTQDLAAIGTHRDPQLMRRYLESYALNTAGIVDHHTIYTAAGVARKTGEAYEQLLRNLLVVDLLPAWWSNRVRRLRQEKGQHEVDLLVEYGAGRVFAFEVKTSSAPRREDARHLTWLRDELGDRFVGGAVLHTGPRAFMMDDRIVAAPLSSLWT
jgi:uncharacterized protein